jgi:hypothetical protein
MLRSAAVTSGSVSIQLITALWRACDTAELNGVSVVTGIEGFCGGRPDVVVERDKDM